MELFALWIAFSIMAAYVASNKGRSGFGWFMLSLILSPLIGFIGALIAKSKDVSTVSNETSSNENSFARNRWEPPQYKNKGKDELENSFGENPFKENDEYEYEDDSDDDEYEESSNLADVSAEKIKALNKLKEDDLINEEEYKEKRKKLLEDMF